MKTFFAIFAVALVLETVYCQGEVPSPTCDVQENYCRKNCADGGGEEGPCKTLCGYELEACKCLQEKNCSTDDCVNGCYDSVQDDYDCDVHHQTCLGFCKNQFAGDENCVSGHCKNLKDKCECFKAGNCPTESATPGPIPMPSCKYMQGKCLKNCRDGEGDDSDCDALCQADADVCACTRKNQCSSFAGDKAGFQKCVRRCQAGQKDTYNCDTFQKTCLGNCKNNFANDANCPNYCSKAFDECKCVMKGDCPA